jgi:hypothetical protein
VEPTHVKPAIGLRELWIFATWGVCPQLFCNKKVPVLLGKAELFLTRIWSYDSCTVHCKMILLTVTLYCSPLPLCTTLFSMLMHRLRHKSLTCVNFDNSVAEKWWPAEERMNVLTEGEDIFSKKMGVSGFSNSSHIFQGFRSIGHTVFRQTVTVFFFFWYSMCTEN